jgi:hypothetical protein
MQGPLHVTDIGALHIGNLHKAQLAPRGSPSEINCSSANQEIPRISCNKMIITAFQTAPSPIPILSHIKPVHVAHPINFNIILPSTSRSSKWPLSLRFPHQNPVCTSPLPRPTHLIWSLAANLNAGVVWSPYVLQFSFTCNCCQHTTLNLRVFIFASALHTAADLT